jgi:hypothetical protein
VLSGPSDPPDATHHAYRKDLADVALAGAVIASHYAEPMPWTLVRRAALHAGPADDTEAICELSAGDPFDMLDNSLGWAWGYGGADRRVGYVESDALQPL